jgi:hypothetical protein
MRNGPLLCPTEDDLINLFLLPSLAGECLTRHRGNANMSCFQPFVNYKEG